MGKPEETVKTVLATFERRRNEMRRAFREIGLRLPPRLEETLRSTREKAREIALLSVQNRPDLDPEDIVRVIDKTLLAKKTLINRLKLLRRGP